MQVATCPPRASAYRHGAVAFASLHSANRNPQPGKKPKLIDADTGPSNSVAHQMYKDGEEPRVHVDTPDEAEAEATKP